MREITYTEALLEAFREEIRGFLRAEVAAERRAVREDGWVVGFSRAFSEKLGARGWLGLTWPKQYGGGGRSVLERLILTEELLRASGRPSCASVPRRSVARSCPASRRAPSSSAWA